MDGFLREVASLALGGLGGALVTLVAWRTRITVMEITIRQQAKELADLKLDMIESDAKAEQRHNQVQRRLLVNLQILAAIAGKVGVDKRYDDLLIRALTGGDDADV
jgi:hypothetical protein